MRFIYLLAPLFLASCATHTYRESQKNIDMNEKETNRLYSRSAHVKDVKNTNKIQVEDKVYVGVERVGYQHGDLLPSYFETNRGVTLVSGLPLTLSEILNLINKATKIPIVNLISANADTNNSALSQPSSAGVIASQLSQAVGQGGVTNTIAQLSHSLSEPDNIQVNYTGPLSSFLNQLASHFDISWRYTGGKIVVSNMEIRTFTITTLPMRFTGSNQVSTSGDSGGGSGGSGGGSGQQSLSISMNMDFWSDLQKNLKIIIGSNGSFNTSTSTSSVTVKTTPSNMVQVENYITKINNELARQVTINVAVYSVEVTDTSNLALSLSGILKQGGRELGTLSSSAFAAGGLPTLTAYFNGDGSDNNEALLSALDKAGKVSIVTSASVTTMSGQPTPLQVGGNRTYVSEIGTTMNNVSTQSTVSTSSISSGFSMNILPRVLDNGQVLLQYGINISSLVGAHNGFDEVTAAGTTIQLPDVQQRSFVQSSLLQNGNTLVLAGYEQQRNETADSGVGDPNFKALGGSRAGSHEKTLVVICITPRVLKLQNGGTNE
ncbi:hypothetical protein NMA30_004139 [Salmonella enterica]|uniref:secretin N-terminal domain-containing protein n=1 Tax=Salmonella enterica TaxID=28901 RepID=UPI001C4586AF|nr:secretin N-terminal domain-containing protein [Salmonella enterica]EDU0380038.1 hypothetical protein [Salmonella enterica subsp. enterica]EJL2370061.1 hypothetical protein [Salmonella enterica]